jgi:DNA (cytosine-5)-methyltransferase 1
MKKIKVLNLYAGIGGNRKLWKNVDVTAVENNQEIADIYKSFFPKDEVIVADAHQFLLEHFKEFDFIWSSPPCPTHSIMRWKMSNSNMKKKSMINLQPKYPNMQLYEEIILLMKYKHNARWVIENVKSYYDPLITPQKVGRHYFWSNFNIEDIKLPAEKINQSRIKEIADLKGIDTNFKIKSESKLKIIRNCVNSKLGLHILECAYKEPKQKLLSESPTSQTKSLRDFPNGEHNMGLEVSATPTPKSPSATSPNPNI